MNDLTIKTDTDVLDPDTMWKQWKTEPTTVNNAAVLKSLSPTIDRAASAYGGPASPLTRSRARVMTLQALQTYDPAKGKLQSHVFNHLQGLRRYTARTMTGVKIPERVMLDRRTVNLARQELADELGREPTSDEIADRTGFSVKRIGKVSNVGLPLAQGQFSQMGEEGAPYDPAVNQPGGSAWMRAIRDDLNPVDMNVFDWALAGVSNGEIARRLRITPGAVSQRKAKIQQLIDQETEISLL